MLQTILASSRVRVLGRSRFQSAARRRTLRTEAGVRLFADLSLQPSKPPRGMVVVVHGWEGSSRSVYVRRAGGTLYRHGFSVCRLNLRDHGDSHHLNRGLFFATLIEEVWHAVRQIAEQAAPLPVCLAGFSLGGNFALRIALRNARHPIPNLACVAAVSPVLDPERATDAIDRIGWMRRYFLHKWHRSLRQKEACFPEIYRFSKALQMTRIRGVTDYLIPRYSPHADAHAYFSGYTLTGDALRPITVPTTIVTAADDPIIPVDDFHRLELSRSTRCIIHRFGGHNGFLQGLSLKSWYEAALVSLFSGPHG